MAKRPFKLCFFFFITFNPKKNKSLPKKKKVFKPYTIRKWVDKTLHSSHTICLMAPYVLLKCKKTKPVNEIQNQCSNWSCRQQHVDGPAASGM